MSLVTIAAAQAVRALNGWGLSGRRHDEDDGSRTVPPEPVPLSDPEFKDQLAAVIPHLRAFGRSLSGSRDLADDLVQETLLKAWAARKRFQAGTNMRAWTFIILRNLFLSQMRRARFKGEWDDITAAKILAAPASQDRHIELGDMQRALMHLPQPQREALILVGAGGFAYEEAAEICGCAVGTIKSRVARGRVALEELAVERQAAVAPAAQDRPGQVGAADHHGRSRRAQPRPRLSGRLHRGARAVAVSSACAEDRRNRGRTAPRAAASKARRSAAVMPAWAGGISTRMILRSMSILPLPSILTF